MCKELKEAVTNIAKWAEEARTEYSDTKEWTSKPEHSCMTIRVPVSLLNRIREAAELAKE